MKYHLAKLPGHDVGLCSAVTPKIMRMAHVAIHLKDRKGKSQLQIELNLPQVECLGLQGHMIMIIWIPLRLALGAPRPWVQLS